MLVEMPHCNMVEQGPEPVLPRDAAAVRKAAADVGLSVPDACMAGVLANLGLLGRHAAMLRGDTRA